MRLTLITALAALGMTLAAGAQEPPHTDSAVVWIGLKNGSEREALMAGELRALLRKHDVTPWLLTHRILIDETQIPHSHPVLTIHTRLIGDELGLLATLVHEQLHWLEAEPWNDDFQAAMQAFAALFPDVPSSAEGGARDDVSTYRHLLVCDMEFQVMTQLVGEAAARATLAQFPYYGWIYEQVLADPRVRDVALRHGFDVSSGLPASGETLARPVQ